MKSRNLLLVIAVAVAMSAACSKVETERPYTAGQFSFSAAVESQVGETKTTLNDGMTGLLWNEGDQVEIYGGDGTTHATYTAASAGASTRLNGEEVGDAPYAAFYPASMVSEWDKTEKTFTVSFPAVQTYVANNIATDTYPMMGYLESGTFFSFRNVGGLVCIKVKAAYDNIKVQYVKVTAATAISGAATVAWNNGAPAITMTGTDEASKSITLDCSAVVEDPENPDVKGVSLATGDSYTPFYIVIPSGEYTGLQVTVTGSIKGNIYSYTASQTLTNTHELSIVRSALSTFKMTAADIVFDLSMANKVSGDSPETANCYLIEQPGKYKFPVTTMGNGVVVSGTGISSTSIAPEDIKSSGVYYTDGSNPISTISVDKATGYATFATPTTLVAGNALFGLFSEAAGTPESNVKGNCIWSWNIWANPMVKDVISSGTSQYTFMDTNIGAFQSSYSESGNGFFYQWGRKDPFLQNGEFVGAWSYIQGSVVTIEDAAKNPTTAYRSTSDVGQGTWCNNVNACVNLWSTNGSTENPASLEVIKTMYDPCPPGYHVPSYKALKYIGDNNATVSKGTPVQYKDWVANGINLQGAGYRFYGGAYIGAQGNGETSFHFWSAFAASNDHAYDLKGQSMKKADPFYLYGWTMGYVIRPEKY